MNPRTAKEVRAQSPVFGLLAACAAVVVVADIIQTPYKFIETVPLLLGVYVVCCLLMAAVTFGNEFHLRTMSLLLSQPVARRTLWPEKMRVLAGFCVSSAFATLIALLCSITVRWQDRYEEFFSICGVLAFVPILFCCTTPYFTLASKSTLGGIVFTIFGSGMLYVLSGAVWDQLELRFLSLGKLKDKLTLGQMDGSTFVFVILSIPYVALLYWLGRRRFLQLEVIDSQSLEANLPQGMETTLASFSAKFKSPFSRLFFKELRLQRISLMLSAAFCLFMIVERLAWNATNNRMFVVAGTLYIYAFIFPVIVCATAVTEEKTWGMKDWHLTLPPSLNQQWRVKWFVALALSLMLGAGLTWLLSRSGPWRGELGVRFEPMMLCYPLLIATALYAGSISTSTIRAFLLTFGITAVFCAVIGTSWNLLTSFRSEPNYVTPLFVIFYVMVQLYVQIRRLLWNLIVLPAYWLTHSHEKTTPFSRWADLSINNNLNLLILGLWIVFFFWLMLRFARTNYRHSDLAWGRVARQLLYVFLAAIFLAVAVGFANRTWQYVPVM